MMASFSGFVVVDSSNDDILLHYRLSSSTLGTAFYHVPSHIDLSSIHNFIVQSSLEASLAYRTVCVLVHQTVLY